MTSAAAPTNNAPKFDLNNPPPGFKWDWDEVKGDHGQLSFGQRPFLTALEGEVGGQGLVEMYGWDGVTPESTTGPPVGFSSRASTVASPPRARRKAGTMTKINATCAEEQLKYRPGRRAAGQSTAQSRAAAAAKKAAGRIGGDAIASMIEKVANMSEEERNILASQLGFDPSLFALAPQGGVEEPEENGEEIESDEAEEQTTA